MARASALMQVKARARPCDFGTPRAADARATYRLRRIGPRPSPRRSARAGQHLRQRLRQLPRVGLAQQRPAVRAPVRPWRPRPPGSRASRGRSRRPGGPRRRLRPPSRAARRAAAACASSGVGRRRASRCRGMYRVTVVPCPGRTPCGEKARRRPPSRREGRPSGVQGERGGPSFAPVPAGLAQRASRSRPCGPEASATAFAAALGAVRLVERLASGLRGLLGLFGVSPARSGSPIPPPWQVPSCEAWAGLGTFLLGGPCEVPALVERLGGRRGRLFPPTASRPRRLSSPPGERLRPRPSTPCRWPPCSSPRRSNT